MSSFVNELLEKNVWKVGFIVKILGGEGIVDRYTLFISRVRKEKLRSLYKIKIVVFVKKNTQRG